MEILKWMGAGCVIGAAVGVTILTGGAAAPAVAGAVTVAEAVVAGAAGAVLGAGAGAAVGVAAEAVIEDRPVENVRISVADVEKKKREEEEEKALRRREEEERVSTQPFVFFCVLHSNNEDEATRSHSGQNTEETQGTGTQTHHGSTSKQDKAEAAAGGAPGGGDPPGGGGGRRDEEDGDSDQETSDSEEDSQQTGEPKKKKGNKVKVLTANLWSLVKKESRVLILMQENQVDVACLTETFLDQNIADQLLSRASGPNFSYQYRNRQIPVGPRRRRRSGGVAILFSTDLRGEPLQFGPTTTFECDSILVQHRDWIRPIVFICLYRRPGQTRRVMVQFLLELEVLLDQARLVSQSITVTGDVNVWVEQETRASNMFQSFLTRNHFQQHVNQPTHRSGHTLDLVLSRNIQISDVYVGEELISDHYPVFFKARPE